MRPLQRLVRNALRPLAALSLSAGLASASAQGGGDTTRVRPDTTRADSLLTSLFGPGSDLGLQFRFRLETKVDRLRNERCFPNQLFVFGNACNSRFEPGLDFQVAVRAGGTVADRIHTDVNYDSKREFDGSNTISLWYTGKEGDWLQRVDVGNVSFRVPASRFISSGIPQGNYGVQAVAKFGSLTVSAIAAEQKGTVTRDRVFAVGAKTSRGDTRDIEDYQVEARKFFFTIDPRLLAGYPNVDILNDVRLSQLAAQLPDTLRPVRVSVYRLLIGGQPANPTGPQFRLIGDPSSRRGQVYELLRENVDYVLHQSRLWLTLAQALDPNRERLVVAYTVRVAGRDTTMATTGGTPDLTYDPTREQFANLLWDPNVRPGDPAFFREIRSVYRIGGEDVRRETIDVRVVTGANFELEKPLGGTAESFLQLFGLSQLGTPTAFDVNQRVWPRIGDPILALGGTATTHVIRDQFLVFPSLQPFARAGLAQPATNPANDAIYTTPNEYLYSPQHPQTIYRIRLKYDYDGSAGEAQSIALGSSQLRPRSERLVLDDGTVLRRDVDYSIDYDLGRVTFLRGDTLFTRTRNITVRFEENPLFIATPTWIAGLAAQLAVPHGELNFVAIGQRQHSSFTRPQLGFENQSAIMTGVSGAFDFDAPFLSRLASRISRSAPQAHSRVRIDAELAASFPQPGGAGQAYLETFEGSNAFTVSLADPNWYYSSQPALGTRLAARIGGASTLDLTRASTMAWQNNGYNPGGSTPTYTLQEIDPLTNIIGGGIQSPEQVLWLDLYPLSIGGAFDDSTGLYRWRIPGAPAGQRWRSIRQVLGPSGIDLTGKETLEFWALVDTTAIRRSANPTLVIDLGDVSENTVAIGPTQLNVTRSGGRTDSTYSGRAIYGRDTLQSERDKFTRAFNQEVNDVGLPGDVVPRLLFASPDSSGILQNFATCARTNRRLARLGDTKTNCTVGNGRLDEWDLDADNVLNFDSSQREQERLFRYVVDFSDPKAWSRTGGCGPAKNAQAASAAQLCWVHVRLNVAAAQDTVNGGPAIRRVRTVRLTVISGAGAAADAFTQLPIARLQVGGAAWYKRSDRTIAGYAGARTGAGLVFTGAIGTQDSSGTLVYQSPPGIIDESDRQRTGLETDRIVINETSLRLTATSLARLERAEAFWRFPEGAKNLQSYKQLRVWARGRGSGWGQNGELQFYIKLGRDGDNFYAYRTPVNAGPGQAAWLPEVHVDFDRLLALRAKLETSWVQNGRDSIACTGVDSALIAASGIPSGQISRRHAACSDGYIVYTLDPGVSPPNLAAMPELAVGMLRVDSASTSATRIAPGDTLELWVDDIRLANMVNTPGGAGQVAIEVNAGDLAQVRLSASHRDANFRQFAEVPGYVTDENIDIATTVRLDRLLPFGSTWALPLTVSHSRASSAPLYLTRSDIRGADLQGLRTPRSSVTSVSLAVRRTTPLTGSWIAPIVNNLSANATVGAASSRSEFQSAENARVNAGVDYAIGGDGAKRAMPGWWSDIFGTVASWLGGAEVAEAVRDAQFRAQPAAFRVSSSVSKADDNRSNFLKVAESPGDTARTVYGRTDVWRNQSSFEVRPFDALSARWEVSTVRDLRDYGDTSATAATATAERSSLLGVNGLERERAVTTTYTFVPALKGWLRPRAAMSTSYGLLRDPNSLQLLREGDTTGALRLPRRVNGAQTLDAGLSIDLARASSAWSEDSAFRRRLTNVLIPIELTWSRTLTSSYDGTPFTPGLGLQFGLGGTGTFLSDHGYVATTAASNAQLAVSTGVRLAPGVTLDARAQRVTLRNWLRRPDKTQAIVDGELLTVPDVGLRATWRPQALDGVITSINANARFAFTRQNSTIPALLSGIPADMRSGHALTYPFGASIAWNDRGSLTTGVTFSNTYRVDSLPGSVTDSHSREMSADLSRSFKLPRDWQMRSDLRTRAGYQQTAVTSWVENPLAPLSRGRLADNGRQAFTLNADTDVAQDMTFSLQAARIVTFDNNLNRRLTQVVFSAVLQIGFSMGELR